MFITQTPFEDSRSPSSAFLCHGYDLVLERFHHPLATSIISDHAAFDVRGHVTSDLVYFKNILRPLAVFRRPNDPSLVY